MKTQGKFVGNIPAVMQQKIENAYLMAKPRVIEYCRRRYGDDKGIGSCLFWALAGSSALAKLGVHSIIQAGTMFMPIVPPDKLDKVKDTQMFNYGYQFNYSAMSMAAMLKNSLPEMHVWLAVLEPVPMLIDFSTGNLRELFDETIGALPGDIKQEWLVDNPPTYLAAEANVDHDGINFTYKTEPVATILAMCLGRKVGLLEKGEDCPAVAMQSAENEYYIRNAREMYLHRCGLEEHKKNLGGACVAV